MFQMTIHVILFYYLIRPYTELLFIVCAQYRIACTIIAYIYTDDICVCVLGAFASIYENYICHFVLYC